ncbi:MAG: tetratricopeptide repeat protein [Bacteroidota bacterium]
MPRKPLIYLAFSCLLFSSPLLFANPLDSLQTFIDRGEVESILALSYELLRTNPESAYELAAQAQQIATRKNDLVQQSFAQWMQIEALTFQSRFQEADSLGKIELARVEAFFSSESKKEAPLLVRAYRLMGFIPLVFGDWDRAMKSLKKGLSITRQIGDASSELALLTNIGNVHYFQKRFKEAQSYYVPAMSIADSLGDISRQGDLANNLAVILENFGRFQDAKAYLIKARGIAIQSQDTLGLINTYLNQGSLYWKNAKVDSSIILWNSAKELSQKTQNTLSYYKAISNLGIAHESKREFGLAIQYYKENLSYNESIPDSLELAKTLANIASAYNKTQQHPKAIKAAEQALRFAKKFNELEVTKVAYQQLIQGYGGIGDFQKAYSYQLPYDIAKDSLMNLQTVEEVLSLQTQYETEKKEKELAQQKILTLEERERNRKLQIGFGASTLILILIGVGIFLRNRFRQQISMQKLIAEQQTKRYSAVIEAEEKERTRIARELHDGIGQLLSTAKMNISTLDEAVESGGDKKDEEILDTSLSLLDEAATEVRQISHNLMPLALKDNGWIVALRNMAKGINTSPEGPKLEIESSEFIGRLAEQKENALYRISQEIINNSLKHSGAKQMRLSINDETTGLKVMFTDDGKGLKLADLEGSQGIGWKNIQARIELLGGKFHVEEAEKGTRIHLFFP